MIMRMMKHVIIKLEDTLYILLECMPPLVNYIFDIAIGPRPIQMIELCKKPSFELMITNRVEASIDNTR